MAFTIKATPRTETGKSKTRKLRRAGTVPAVMYGHGDQSTLLSLNDREFTRLLQEIRGSSPVVELDINGKPLKCVIKTLQRNPIDGSLLHVDFQKVHPHEKITMQVPVITHGIPKGIKSGGMLERILRAVPVHATIDKIPRHFDIDITDLNLGQSFHVSDLKAEDIEFTIPTDSPIVTIIVPRKLAAAQAEAEAPVTAEETETKEEEKEPELVKEKKTDEGKTRGKEDTGSKPGHKK